MSRLLVAMLLSIAGLVPAQAKELTFGGIELSVTSCDEAESILSGARSIEGRDTSVFTQGRMFRLAAGAMGVDFVRSGSVICRAIAEGERSTDLLVNKSRETVAAIELIIDKRQAGTVADLLSQSYRQTSRKLPNLGAGQARYISDSGVTSARISYVHLSFDAQVRMSTQEFDALFDAAVRNEERQNQRRLEGAF